MSDKFTITWKGEKSYKMNIETISIIVTLALDVLGAVGFIVSFVALKKKGKTTEEATEKATKVLKVANKANDAAQKAFDKVCKKNKVSTSEALMELQTDKKE